jgi:tol-pal system beta propeller repeat protein TolB
MTSKRILIALAVFLLAFGLFSQQEVVLKISEGMPMINLALPDLVVRTPTDAARAAAEEIHQVLAADVAYSRVFQPLPKAYYAYIRPLNPEKIHFKDWDGIQARLLLVGEISEDGGRFVFDGKLYDVRSERYIIGKRYQSDKSGLRLVAHKMADELMKLYGEKPVFATKIAFVSNRDGNDEIYMMDYDGANPTRITFNKIKDYMPAWSPDQRTIAFTSYRSAGAHLCLRNIYEGTETLVSSKGTNYAAAFSPDGGRLAFCSTMTEDGNAEIYVLDLAAMRTRRLTYNSATDTAPTWSPTGREIAFTTDRLGAGSPQIYVMDAEGSNVRKVSYRRQLSRRPGLGPDRRPDRLRLAGREQVRPLRPQPPDEPDRQAHREQRLQRIPELVARRPPRRVLVQHVGLDPDLLRRLRRGQPQAADGPRREQAAQLDELDPPQRDDSPAAIVLMRSLDNTLGLQLKGRRMLLTGIILMCSNLGGKCRVGGISMITPQGGPMKKLIVLSLAIVLILSLSVSCKKKPQEIPEPPPQVQEQPPVEQVAPPVVQEPKLTEEEIFLQKSLEQINREKPLAMIHFDYDKSLIRDDAKPVLEANAAWLSRFRTIKILIEGHCDERGTEEYNLALGERRAKSTMDYLLSLGVARNA